jgi:hypothetical protein
MGSDLTFCWGAPKIYLLFIIGVSENRERIGERIFWAPPKDIYYLVIWGGGIIALLGLWLRFATTGLGHAGGGQATRALRPAPRFALLSNAAVFRGRSGHLASGPRSGVGLESGRGCTATGEQLGESSFRGHPGGPH